MADVKRRLRRVVSILIVLLIATGASAQIARVFLSGTGDDTNDCSNAATPCRSLQGALNQCAVGGEVIVMSSGGFGAATITQSVTINVPSGVVAFDARTITVNIGSTDKVVIRGLSMNGAVFGDPYGLYFKTGGTLVVEGSVMAGFLYGIVQEAGGSQLVVNNCDFRNNSTAVFAQLGNGVSALSTLTIENSRIVNRGAQGFGVFLYDYIRAVVRDTVVIGAGKGFAIWQSVPSGGSLLVDGCVAAHNTTGVYSRGDNGIVATLRITNSTIAGNDRGLFTDFVGVIVSQGGNQLWGNGIDGTFNATVAQQ
jgi:hypothetical protein